MDFTFHQTTTPSPSQFHSSLITHQDPVPLETSIHLTQNPALNGQLVFLCLQHKTGHKQSRGDR